MTTIKLDEDDKAIVIPSYLTLNLIRIINFELFLFMVSGPVTVRTTHPGLVSFH